jgi:hypothetical protein
VHSKLYRAKLLNICDASNDDTSAFANEEPHMCDGMKDLERQVAKLVAEVQLLRLGTRFAHIANNSELVSVFV